MISRTVDRTNGVKFECHPAASTQNGRPGPDPDREVWDGTGVLTEEPIYDAVEVGNRNRVGNDFRALVRGYNIELSVDTDPRRNPGARTTKQGDRLRMDDMRDFEISSVRPDGMGRIVFKLLAIRT
jgi:hypothetical protein